MHMLAAENGALVDEIDWAEGDASAGGSLSRVPDGDGEFVTVTPDTRGAPNDG